MSRDSWQGQDADAHDGGGGGGAPQTGEERLPSVLRQEQYSDEVFLEHAMAAGLAEGRLGAGACVRGPRA